MATKTEKPGTEVIKFNFKEIPSTELAQMATVEDAIQYLVDRGITPRSIEDFGDGFKILTREAKSILVGKGFFIVGWRKFVSDKFGMTEGVALYVITTDGTNEKYCIIDLSKGISKQIHEEIAPVTDGGVLVPSGLTRSEYDTVVNINGKDTNVHGVTYYLDKSVAA